MSFKEFHARQKAELHEALNSKVDYTVTADTAELFKTEAIIGSRRIVFEASQDDPEDDMWDVSFSETTKSGSNMKFDATGSGNELDVFSMIRSSMEDFISRRNPLRIRFSASKFDGEGRANLYDRMVKRFATDRYSIYRRKEGHDDYFTLTRKE